MKGGTALHRFCLHCFWCEAFQSRTEKWKVVLFCFFKL